MLCTERTVAEIFTMGVMCFAIMEVITFTMRVVSQVAQLVNRDADSTVKIMCFLGLLWV